MRSCDWKGRDQTVRWRSALCTTSLQKANLLKRNLEVLESRFRNGVSFGIKNSNNRTSWQIEYAGIHAGGGPGIVCGGDAGITDRPGRWCGDRAAADAGVRGGHSLRDWRFAGFSDRYFVGSGRGVSSGRVFEYARGDVFGNCDDCWGGQRSVSRGIFAHFDYRDRIWRGAALFRVCVHANAGRSARGNGAGSNRDDAAAGRVLSDGRWNEVVSRAACAAGVWVDVRGRGAFGIAGDRIGSGESAGDGSGDEDTVQGVDYDQQFHDRRDGGSERGHLSAARLH